MTPLAGWRSNLATAFIAALAGALVGAAVLSGPLEIAASAFLAATMGVIALEDSRRMRVPDPWSFAAALGGFVAAGSEAMLSGAAPLTALGHAVVSLVLCGGIFYLMREIFFRLRGMDGLGLGDVKLAATGGIWVGWEIFSVVVMLAALGAIVWVAVAAILGRGWARERKIPFGAFLAPAIWICWVYARMAQI